MRCLQDFAVKEGLSARWRPVSIGDTGIGNRALDHEPMPDKQHNDQTQRRTDQSSALIVPIPSNALSDERSDESPGNPDHYRH